MADSTLGSRWTASQDAWATGSTWCVLSTLGQALDLVERFPARHAGVIVDALQVWWDPDLLPALRRARGRIASFQIRAWITPLPPDALLSRGMPGDGHVDLRLLRRSVDQAGYDGDVEVEVFNAQVWASDPDDVVATVARQYVEHVLEPHAG